jgi:hypothetical protein
VIGATHDARTSWQHPMAQSAFSLRFQVQTERTTPFLMLRILRHNIISFVDRTVLNAWHRQVAISDDLSFPYRRFAWADHSLWICTL